MEHEVIEGDCLEVLPTLADASIDAVICDPPYPEISRPYGRMTEAAWTAMMHRVVPEVRRIIKPRGSAVFVLQPNSRKVGSMRAWLWEFMAWCCREWNMVQDVWWWNVCAIPAANSTRGGLTRPSLKACVWLGPPDCYRDQDAVLGPTSPRMLRHIKQSKSEDLGGSLKLPSGHGMDVARTCRTVERRGGVTPFNVLAMNHGDGQRSAGAHGHPAGTPLALCDWWIRYLVPSDGMVLDPFAGSCTVGVAAIKRGHSFIGIEKVPEYCAIARTRLERAGVDRPLLSAK